MKWIFIISLYLVSFGCYAQSEETTFILLRHAEEGFIGTDPTLSDEGVKRAECLAQLLSFTNVNAVYTSPYNRTRQTAKHIAEKQELEVQEYDPNNGNLTEELKRKHKGETIVLVGDASTIPLYINALKGTNEYQPLPDEEYGTVYFVSTTLYKTTDVMQVEYELSCELTND